MHNGITSVGMDLQLGTGVSISKKRLTLGKVQCQYIHELKIRIVQNYKEHRVGFWELLAYTRKEDIR